MGARLGLDTHWIYGTTSDGELYLSKRAYAHTLSPELRASQAATVLQAVWEQVKDDGTSYTPPEEYDGIADAQHEKCIPLGQDPKALLQKAFLDVVPCTGLTEAQLVEKAGLTQEEYEQIIEHTGLSPIAA